jgi:hypothetical protein
MRAAIITAVTAAVLAVTNSASYAADGDPTVTVADRPGAPREALQQLEKMSGSPLGTLDRVLAVDAGGARLTGGQAEALVAGKEVDGVMVLGVMPGSQDVLDTTMFDLSDGAYDGPRSGESFTSALIFATYVPEGREWCLTMCISTGRTVAECILLSRR